MARQLTDREISLILNFGALHYTPEMIFLNLDGFTQEEVENELKNPNSMMSITYRKGQARAQFLIDSKLFELAKTGDLAALEKYERRLRENEAKKKPGQDEPDLF